MSTVTPSIDASDARGQLARGIALQAAGRHAEALVLFTAARQALPGEAAAHLHVAVSLLELGAADQALTAASDACHCAPGAAQAHYVYGQAWAALNQAARAEEAFGEAIRLAPRFVDAWINYGLAHYRQGRIEPAKLAMRQALAVDPANEAAASNLAAFMRISGEGEAAERLLDDLLRARPDAVGARLNRAAELLQEARPAEALAMLDETHVPIDPGAQRHWRLQQSLALAQLGRPTEARDALAGFTTTGPTPDTLLPMLRWREVLIAALEGDTAGAARAAEAMEAALVAAGATLVPEHAIMARFDLAKFWSGRGAHARAFSHWREGHRLLAPFQPFSRNAHRAFIDASINHFSRELLRDGSRADNRDPMPVFVVGMPRSGTTLTEQILAAHRDVHGAGERMALPELFADLCQPLRDGEPMPPTDIAALNRSAGDYLAALHALAPGALRVVDKMPGNFAFLGLVARVLPGARIIHCVRDPRDIGLSLFTFRLHGEHGYAHDLGDLGWYIGQHDRIMTHWRTALPTPVLTVALADWVNDFSGTLARVLRHLELPPDENCFRFHEAESRVRTVSRAQVRQPVNANGLGRWRAYASELAPLIAELEAVESLAGWGA